MRIRDWSSDVCSSDLRPRPRTLRRGGGGTPGNPGRGRLRRAPAGRQRRGYPDRTRPPHRHELPRVGAGRGDAGADRRTERKSVGSGKSVSVSVDLGGRRNITKKKIQYTSTIEISTRTM